MIRFFEASTIARMLCMMALVLLMGVPRFVHAQPPRNALPAISENKFKSAKVSVANGRLFAFEQAARQKFADKEPPDEIFLLAWSSAAEFLLFPPASVDHPRGMLLIEVRNDRGDLRTTIATNFGEWTTRRALSDDELKHLRDSIKTHKCDNLPQLNSTRFVRGRYRQVLSGRIYVYLHMSPQSGSRVWMNNPPTEGDQFYPPDDPHWEYSRLVDLFLKLDSDAAKD